MLKEILSSWAYFVLKVVSWYRRVGERGVRYIRGVYRGIGERPKSGLGISEEAAAV